MTRNGRGLPYGWWRSVVLRAIGEAILAGLAFFLLVAVGAVVFLAWFGVGGR